MYCRRHELEPVPPNDRLNVIGIGPERMQDVIGTNRDIGIVADKAAAEVVACVDRMCGDNVANTCAQISDGVVEPRVMDVVPTRQAVDPAPWWGWRIGAGLPRRD